MKFSLSLSWWRQIYRRGLSLRSVWRVEALLGIPPAMPKPGFFQLLGSLIYSKLEETFYLPVLRYRANRMLKSAQEDCQKILDITDRLLEERRD